MPTSSIFHQFIFSEKEYRIFMEEMREKPEPNDRVKIKESTQKRGEELLKTFKFR